MNGDWKVDWAPSVINPSLGPGERLATVTRFSARASVLDAEGNPLQLPAPAYELGVWPDRLASQAATARAFANVTQLQAAQILGQITAAPPNQFVRLATLDPGTYAGLRSQLRSVPGLVVRRVSERLFQARATELVGEWAVKSTRAFGPTARSTSLAPQSGCPAWKRPTSASSSARRRPR